VTEGGGIAAGAGAARAGPAWWRVPLLVFALAALVVGVGAGLARLGWSMPGPAVQAAAWHGPLLVCGFFGGVIALERAVALARGWAYAAPLAAGLGSAAILHGFAAAGPWLYLAGGLALLAATLAVLRRQREGFVLVLAVAAACWPAGVALWLAGVPLPEVLPWWLAFLVLTIAGERLELSRLLPRPPHARGLFALIVACVLIGAALATPAPWAAASARDWGQALFGAALAALAVWLTRYDLARRTVRMQGLPRFTALSLLGGYAWLALAGVLIALFPLVPGHAAYDAALHALLLGFVFAMVFGHAPIIFPAVLRVRLTYHAGMFVPLGLLHASLALRLAGRAADSLPMVRWGAIGSALALLAFIAAMLWAARLARRPAAAQPRAAT
jgi:hypothetical protein